MTILIKKGSAAKIPILLVDATDDESSETGLSSINVEISKNGGGFNPVTNSVVEDGGGFYYVTLTAAETNTDGVLAVRAWASGTNIYRDYHQVYTNLLTEAEYEAIADITIRRITSNVEGSSYGDALNTKSLYGLIQFINNSIATGGVRTIYRSDGVTVVGTSTLTQNPSANPTVGVDT